MELKATQDRPQNGSKTVSKACFDYIQFCVRFWIVLNSIFVPFGEPFGSQNRSQKCVDVHACRVDVHACACKCACMRSKPTWPPQEVPRPPQEAARTPPRGPKTSQRGFKTFPRGVKVALRSFKIPLWSHQNLPNSFVPYKTSSLWVSKPASLWSPRCLGGCHEAQTI